MGTRLRVSRRLSEGYTGSLGGAVGCPHTGCRSKGCVLITRKAFAVREGVKVLLGLLSGAVGQAENSDCAAVRGTNGMLSNHEQHCSRVKHTVAREDARISGKRFTRAFLANLNGSFGVVSMR